MTTVPAAGAPASYTPATDTTRSGRSALWWMFGAVFVVSLVVALLGPEAGAVSDNAKALTLISGTAVAIERLIELLWTALGRLESYGGWWPLNIVSAEMVRFENETAAALAVPIATLKADLEQMTRAVAGAGASVARLDERVTAVQTAADKAGKDFHAALGRLQKTLPPGSGRVAAVAQAAQTAFQRIDSAAAEAFSDEHVAAAAVKTRLAALHAGADSALAVVESFADNPARRIASLLLGMSAGVAAVGVMGLNMVTAVLGGSGPGWLSGRGGVVLTGLVVGLGTNPTHEAIKLLTKVKQRNAIGQDVPDVTGTTARATPTARTIKATD